MEQFEVLLRHERHKSTSGTVSGFEATHFLTTLPWYSPPTSMLVLTSQALQ